jgi:hypothetical protein
VVAIVIPIVIRMLVPLVVVVDVAPVAIPVAGIIALTIMVRRYPVRACIHGASPISVVPLIVVADRIPVAGYEGIALAGTSRLHPYYAIRRRGADPNSDGNLSEHRSSSQQHQYKHFSFHDSIPFLDHLRYGDLQSTLLAVP